MRRVSDIKIQREKKNMQYLKLTKFLYRTIMSRGNALYNLHKLKLRYVNGRFYSIEKIYSTANMETLILSLEKMGFNVNLVSSNSVLVQTPTGFWKQI